MNVDEVIIYICEIFGVSLCDLKSKKRDRVFLYPRVAVSVFLSKYIGLSLTNIGYILNRKHTTVLYYINEVYPNEYKYNIDFRNKINKILTTIKYKKHFIKAHKITFCYENLRKK